MILELRHILGARQQVCFVGLGYDKMNPITLQSKTMILLLFTIPTLSKSQLGIRRVKVLPLKVHKMPN